jgi:hypothetical protein
MIGDKMRIFSSLLLIVATTTPVLAKKPEQTCKVTFGLECTDSLGNDLRGIHEKKHLKQVQSKLNKYGDVCYTDDHLNADYIFYVHTKPATYHGVRTFSNTETHTDTAPMSGTIRDEDGNTSHVSGTADTTTRTTTSTPYEVDYDIFILDIMVPHQTEGSTERAYTRLRTFAQSGLYNTIYGIGFGKRKNPIVNVIDAAAKWLHENNLGK